MSVGSLPHEEDCARGSQEYDQCGYRVGDAGPRYPALKPASGAKYAGIAYPAAIIIPGIASRNCFQESPPPGFAHPVPDPGEPSGFPLSFGRRCSMRSGIFPCSNPVTVGCPASFPPVSVVPSSPPGFPPGPSRASSTLASLCSGRDGESHHGALPVLRFPQFRSGGAVHGEETGARLDPQLPARLPHLGDSHP